MKSLAFPLGPGISALGDSAMASAQASHSEMEKLRTFVTCVQMHILSTMMYLSTAAAAHMEPRVRKGPWVGHERQAGTKHHFLLSSTQEAWHLTCRRAGSTWADCPWAGGWEVPTG